MNLSFKQPLRNLTPLLQQYVTDGHHKSAIIFQQAADLTNAVFFLVFVG